MIKKWDERIVPAAPPCVEEEEIHMAMLAEIDELRAKLAAAETSANELRRAVAELIGADPETWPNHGNAPLAIAACVAVRQVELAALEVKLASLEQTHDQRFVELTRLRQHVAGLEAQEPYELEWPDYHPEGMGCGLEDRNITDRYEAMQYGWEQALEHVAEQLPERLYLAAGAAPVQQEPEPIQVCRLMKKEEGIWVAASEFYAGHPDQKWVKLVSTNPGSWSIQRRVTGKQIADGLAKALAGTPPALEVTECQWSFEDDDSGTWRSSCGELWSFIDGGPNENRVTYCHHCGGKVSNAAAAPAAKVPEEPRIDINDLSGMIAAVIKEQTP